MKPKSNIYRLYALLIILIVPVVIPAHSQERKDIYRSKSVFVEIGGSGVAVLTANFDFRFFKGRSDGLGMRFGIGGENSTSEPLFGEGHTDTKLFTVPIEFNYIYGKKRFAFEVGYSFTYVSGSENSKYRIFSSDYYYFEDSGNFIVSYVPFGFRLKPKTDGFMLKFNLGPMISYTAPNIIYYDKVQAWAGLAIGYSFY
jgi:hypothetical protein